LIPDNLVGVSLKVEQIKEMNAKLIEVFEAARQKVPNDPELLVLHKEFLLTS
jgi:hypothetical protein